MARAGTSLQIKFGTTRGDKTWTFNYAKQALTEQAVRSVAQAMIDNGSIFQNQPLSLQSAQLVQTTIVPVVSE